MIRQTQDDSTRNHRLRAAIVAAWQPSKRLSTQGFTLLELIVVVLIISILFAIMVPGWAAFMNVQRLNVAQNTVLQAMRDAQSRAKYNHIVWQASFQTANGIVQWAVHPASAPPAPSLWNSLDPNIQIDTETTLQLAGGLRKVQFDHQGHVNGQLGRLTLSGKIDKGEVKPRRCVIVSTLLGALRTGRDNPTKDDGKYCY